MGSYNCVTTAAGMSSNKTGRVKNKKNCGEIELIIFKKMFVFEDPCYDLVTLDEPGYVAVLES